MKFFEKITKREPYFIAEISANHNGNLDIAKKLIRTAKKYGASAVKFQTYTANTMTLKSEKKEFKIKSGLWKGYALWQLYKKAETPFKWHKYLFEYAKKINIKCFSTPFDDSAVELLENLKCSIYKIASSEITHLPLIKKVAQTKKPIILSTGAANLSEIEDAYLTAKRNGARDIAILYCVSNYPAKYSDFNFNNIKILKKKFKCVVGFSDHSNDHKIVSLAVSAGARIIEKHIVNDYQKKGIDINFSLKGKEILNYKNLINSTFEMTNKNYFFRSKEEYDQKKFRRSIFAICNIKKNDRFSDKNIRILRPNLGLDPKYYFKIVNKKSPIDIKSGIPLNKKILKKLKIKECK